MFSIFVLLVFLLISGGESHKIFNADIEIRVPNGKYDAKMYYLYNETANSNYHIMRLEYSFPLKMTDLINYVAPRFFKLSTDVLNTTVGTIDGCQKYERKVADGATAVWMKDNTICRAELSDGRLFVFKNIKTTSDTSKSKITDAVCPQPICKRVMDLIIVLDISFSICVNDVGYETNCDLTDWKKIQKFAEDIINSFDIGEDATMVGIVTFAGDAKDVVDISSDKQKIINSLYNINKMDYATCIGCGVENAINMFKRVSANREARKPEKMVIFMTDGGNNKPDQRGYVAYCSDYRPKCKRFNNSKCVRYRCNDKNPKCKVYSTTECETYTNGACAKYKCSSCSKYSTKCLRNSTSSCISYICTQNSTTPVCGHPDCCSWSGSRCRNDNYCWWKCSGVQCTQIGYSCQKRQCVEYACEEYDCETCSRYSSTCQEYTKQCTTYKCDAYDCQDEVCDEYECLEYELECAGYRNGYDGHFRGVTSILHSPYGLLPQSSTPITTIAIGVGHDIVEAEVRRVSSSLEGKKLYYTLDNFDQLAGIINELVDETCGKMEENLEMCSKEECKGLCGCEKKCYCPTCDQGDYCNPISCVTDSTDTQSLGCVVNPVSCTSKEACVEVSRNPKTLGCCVEKLKDCSYLEDKCHLVYCDNSTGCYTREIEPNPESPCLVGDYCDPLNGWVYKTACPNISKCYSRECKVVAGTMYKCEETSLCHSDDLCINATCDEETGKCTKEPFICPPSENLCMQANCYNGNCFYSVNITRTIECSSAANSSCYEGYCEPTTGECETRSLEDESPDCGICDTTPLDCSTEGTPCQSHSCDVNKTTKVPYCRLDADSCPPSDDPCTVAECALDEDGKGYCKRTPVICDPKKCFTMTCQRDPENPSKHKCVPEPICKSDACFDRTCNEETGECEETPLCPSTPCNPLVTCNIGPNGERECVNDPVVCKSDNCTESHCDEETGKCVDVDNSTNCDGGNPCVEYRCSKTKGCYEIPIDCNDTDPCTDDYCIPYNPADSAPASASSGSKAQEGGEYEELEKFISVSSEYDEKYVCVHKPKCNSGRYCVKASCSLSGTCTFTDYNCENDPRKANLDTCHTMICDEESSSCKVTLLASAFLDVCGGCVKSYGTNATLNLNSVKNACIAGMKMPEFAAAIGGAAVAGIVIAAIIVAAIIGVSSALGTKELIKRAKKNAEVSTNSNPLYEDKDNEGVNPAFTGEE